MEYNQCGHSASCWNLSGHGITNFIQRKTPIFYVILEISNNFRIANFYSVHMKDIPNEPTVREIIQSWNDNTIGHTHRHTEDASEAATSEIKINNPSRDTNMPFQGC